MMPFDVSRRIAAEALGTAFLVGTVVGSGIMAEQPGRRHALSRCSATPFRPALSWWC